jgi:3-deoxy-D-manno-octulosonic-acid transferase
VLDALFADKARRIAMGAAGAAFASRHRGATARTVDVLAALLPPAERMLQDAQDTSDDE